MAEPGAAKNATAGTDVSDGSLALGFLPGLVGFQLRRAQISVFRHFMASLSELDVSPGQLGVLVIVGCNPGITQVKLAEAAGIDRSTMVALLDRFEGRGLLVRTRSRRDRRAHAVDLTVAGERLVKRAEGLIAEHEALITRDLSAAEREVLIGLLARVAAAAADDLGGL